MLGQLFRSRGKPPPGLNFGRCVESISKHDSHPALPPAAETVMVCRGTAPEATAGHLVQGRAGVQRLTPHFCAPVKVVAREAQVLA